MAKPNEKLAASLAQLKNLQEGGRRVFRSIEFTRVHRERLLRYGFLQFDLIEKETVASVRAVLGHWLFGYIHPYPEGNGRMARFVMNVMLASGGYPWTIIRVQDRDAYLTALESASVDQDIEPFARFVSERVERSLEQMV